jgi:hypothetical protein
MACLRTGHDPRIYARQRRAALSALSEAERKADDERPVGTLDECVRGRPDAVPREDGGEEATPKSPPSSRRELFVREAIPGLLRRRRAMTALATVGKQSEVPPETVCAIPSFS